MPDNVVYDEQTLRVKAAFHSASDRATLVGFGRMPYAVAAAVYAAGSPLVVDVAVAAVAASPPPPLPVGVVFTSVSVAAGVAADLVGGVDVVDVDDAVVAAVAAVVDPDAI